MFDEVMEELGIVVWGYISSFLIYFGVPFLIAVIILRVVGASPKVASLIGAILGVIVYWQFGIQRFI